jgi:pimeloyl-ACP methyl ester carboxylesterase
LVLKVLAAIRSPPFRFFTASLGILIVAYGLYLLGIYNVQKYLIFQPKPVPENYTYRYQSIDTPPKTLKIKAADGLPLDALLFEHAHPRGCIVFYHGNGDNLADLEDPVRKLYSRGYHVLVWDYREYGKTGGTLSYDHIMSDAVAVCSYADSVYNKPIIPYGISLGTALAAKAAAEFKVQKVMLQSPFFSFTQLGPHYLPAVPYQLLLKYPFNTYKPLKDFNGIIAAIHGKQDRIIPFSQSRLLADSLTGNFHLKAMPQCGHNNLPLYPGYSQWLNRWLSSPRK